MLDLTPWQGDPSSYALLEYIMTYIKTHKMKTDSRTRPTGSAVGPSIQTLTRRPFCCMTDMPVSPVPQDSGVIVKCPQDQVGRQVGYDGRHGKHCLERRECIPWCSPEEEACHATQGRLGKHQEAEGTRRMSGPEVLWWFPGDGVDKAGQASLIESRVGLLSNCDSLRLSPYPPVVQCLSLG